MCFPFFPFPNGSFYGDYPVPAVTLYIGCQGGGGKTTCLFVHRSPDYKLLHMDLVEWTVYHSELLDFELEAVTGWSFELYSLAWG